MLVMKDAIGEEQIQMLEMHVQMAGLYGSFPSVLLRRPWEVSSWMRSRWEAVS